MTARIVAAVVIYRERPAWYDDAACRGIDPALFYPGPGDVVVARQARAVCDVCPVQRQCLSHALACQEHHGIWGGRNERERMRMRGQQAS